MAVSSGPTSLTNCPGTTASFSVSATGTALSYQWYKGVNPLSGQTGSSLTLNNVSAADAATYTIIVNGTCNSVTNTASLAVNQNVAVSSGPTSLTNCPGTTASFSVSATGTALSYQWYKGVNPLSGQTGSSLTLNNVSASDAGSYSVVVGGACGNAITNSASLTVNQNLAVSVVPVSATNCPGTPASFSVVASGTGLNYQWYKGLNPLPGQTGSTLNLASVSAADAGTYTVIASGVCGNAATNSANLSVNQNVAVSSGPTSLTNCPGTTASFSVSATGTALSYQWYKGVNPLSGQTGSSLTLNNVSASDAGSYSVVVGGACGNAITNSASLTVNQNLAVSVVPVSATNCPGTPASFSVVASGTGLNYQWYKGLNPLPGQTGSTLNLASVSAADAGTYTVIASGVCGNAATNSANLSVIGITVATPLTSATNNLGTSITFSTLASGTGPFTYTWKKNGSTLAGQSGASLVLTNLGYSDAGDYTVEVSGACNTAVQTATLTVNHPPTVTILSPTNGAIFFAPADMTILADAQDVDGTISKVEFFSSTNKIGETTNAAPYFIVLTNVASGDYQFTARATDNLGATGTSTPVTVHVIDRLPLTIITAMHLNPQTGLFEQTVRVTNPTYSTADAIRVYAYGLTNGATLYNASGSTTNGIPYVQSHAPVAAGSYVDFVIEYYVPSRIAPNPTLIAELVEPQSIANAIGIGQHIERGIVLPDKTFLIEFLSLSNRLYYIQYTTNLTIWQTAIPAITGNGSRVQWIDNGQPKTESSPATLPARYYRLILLP